MLSFFQEPYETRYLCKEKRRHFLFVCLYLASVIHFNISDGWMYARKRTFTLKYMLIRSRRYSPHTD